MVLAKKAGCILIETKQTTFSLHGVQPSFASLAKLFEVRWPHLSGYIAL